MASIKNKEITGIILASGEGSRMAVLSQSFGLPKHLFPLASDPGNHPVARLYNQLKEQCQEVLCIVPEKWQHAYRSRRELDGLKIVVKTEAGFHNDFRLVLENASFAYLMLAVGDILYPDTFFSSFYYKATQAQRTSREKIVLALEKNRLLRLPPDIRMLAMYGPRTTMDQLRNLNPELAASFLQHALRLLLQRRLAFTYMDSLFNLNRPEDYERATFARHLWQSDTKSGGE